MKLMTDRNYVVARGKFTREYFVFDVSTFFFERFENYEPILYTDNLQFAKRVKQRLNNLRA